MSGTGGTLAYGSRLSLGDYLRRWLDETARPSVSANTVRGYEDILTHLKPIADIPLSQLTAEDIEACCNRMVTHRIGASEQRPAAAKTVRNAQVMLRRALGQAELRGHVRRNEAKLVPLREFRALVSKPSRPSAPRPFSQPLLMTGSRPPMLSPSRACGPQKCQPAPTSTWKAGR